MFTLSHQLWWLLSNLIQLSYRTSSILIFFIVFFLAYISVLCCFIIHSVFNWNMLVLSHTFTGIRPDRSKGGQSTRCSGHRPGSHNYVHANANASAAQRSDVNSKFIGVGLINWKLHMFTWTAIVIAQCVRVCGVCVCNPLIDCLIVYRYATVFMSISVIEK